MSAKVSGSLSREASAIAYKEALISLSDRHRLHMFGIREYVRHLHNECAHWRNRLRDEERRTALLRQEIRELREGAHIG